MRKKILAYIITAALVSMIPAGCYYDNEEDLYPTLTGPCDTLNVTFTSSIEPVLTSNCLSCHSDANSQFGGGIRLEALPDVKARSGAILAAISHTGPVPMPPSGKLSQCSIDKFRIWIRNGMPD